MISALMDRYPLHDMTRRSLKGDREKFEAFCRRILANRMIPKSELRTANAVLLALIPLHRPCVPRVGGSLAGSYRAARFVFPLHRPRVGGSLTGSYRAARLSWGVLVHINSFNRVAIGHSPHNNNRAKSRLARRPFWAL